MIDPGFLEELERLRAAREQVVASERAGERESEAVGEGRTFADYRRYSPGDDIRLIDWKLYARTGEHYVKQFEAERNLTVHALVDASASMGFGEPAKFDVAAKVGLGACALTAAAHDEFRFSTFAREPRRLDGGASTAGEVLALVDRCNETDPAGESDFERALEAYAGRINSRSLVVIASDFLDEPGAVETGLRALSRNDVVLAHVVAHEERDPPIRGDAVFEDPESDRSLETYFGGRLAERYRSRLDAHVADVAERAERLRLRHERVDTDEDFFDAFGRVWVE